MKDLHDKATIDLIDKPRRGRPSTGKAKTQAQIQREYRARKKSTLEQLPTLAQALAGFEVWYLPKGCRKWRKYSGYDPLSWNAANSVLRSLILGHELTDPVLPELAARYEIRPADLPGSSRDDDKRARRSITFDFPHD